MHPALKRLVEDPALGCALYALIADDHHCVSRFHVIPYPTYDVDGDDVVLQETEVALILDAIQQSTGLRVALIDEPMGPAQTRVSLPQEAHLPLLRALLIPEEYA